MLITRSVMLLFAAIAVFGPPALQGEPLPPYEAGSTTRFFHDESRPFDSVAGVDSGVRVLLTEIWYPVERASIRGDARHPTYGDYVFGDREMHRRMMTQMVTPPLTTGNTRSGVTQAQIDQAIDEHFSRTRSSYVDAPPASKAGGFPVVVMSHGDGGTRYNMESVAENLATHGYVVIAPEHAGNASFVLTGKDPALQSDPDFADRMTTVITLHDDKGAYGAPENSGQSLPRNESGALTIEVLKVLDLLLLQRINDLRAILGLLPQLNKQGLFAGRINDAQIGVMGRSFGGATTLAALGLEPRFRAGVAIVAPSVPDFRSNLPQELLLPLDEESVMFSSGSRFPLGQLSKPTFLLNSAEDKLIININLGLSIAYNSQRPTAENPHPQLRHAFQNSQAPVAWGIFDNGNHGTLSVSGPYWWPGLRENRFPRYFEPDVQYTLTPAGPAHQILAEKTRLFFDLTLQNNEAAKEELVKKPEAGSDFRFETRNLE